jgi:DNA invertase Pin-like site-specific DNA recombinase
MKVAIYARYSSENQRDASIADQFRVCREFAQRQGWHVAAEFSDHAVSGATILRPGFQAMMREALQKKVDIVMAEALDRFSRDQRVFMDRVERSGAPARFMEARSVASAFSTTSCTSAVWYGIGSDS